MDFSPLSDQAVLARFEDESSAARWAIAVREAAPPWLIDVVPAYVTVAVYFDAAQIRYASVQEWLSRLKATEISSVEHHRSFIIPCCYEMGADLARVAQMKNLSPAEVIAIHSGAEYTVYAIGFCPGFPYLGYLSRELTGIPRLDSPRIQVEPGSVGLTGRQTGIYPLPSPGGWHLIGRTPLVLVDLKAGFFGLAAGDRVRFTAINEREFDRLRGQQVQPE